ncbi:hypothetical protein FIBSPDRAFT_969252 [Athelia psychrophila]|uniref:Uncharacterized protein n=1 Tax=Athelia psychrophila TaxID=1759441 RepID=A0A167TQC3_9AGAM|nr:hypothetical protein FIBSPDRAFT_969252 [Fibularhizoctonia sp. CBS 109695]
MVQIGTPTKYLEVCLGGNGAVLAHSSTTGPNQTRNPQSPNLALNRPSPLFHRFEDHRGICVCVCGPTSRRDRRLRGQHSGRSLKQLLVPSNDCEGAQLESPPGIGHAPLPALPMATRTNSTSTTGAEAPRRTGEDSPAGLGHSKPTTNAAAPLAPASASRWDHPQAARGR